MQESGGQPAMTAQGCVRAEPVRLAKQKRDSLPAISCAVFPADCRKNRPLTFAATKQSAEQQRSSPVSQSKRRACAYFWSLQCPAPRDWHQKDPTSWLL